MKIVGGTINNFKSILWINGLCPDCCLSWASMGISMEAHVKKKIGFLPLRPRQNFHAPKCGGIKKSLYNA